MGEIAQAVVQAPCPMFSGRALDNRGFIFKGKESAFLTSTQTNIDSEKGMLSVFGYSVAKGAYDSSADRSLFLVYAVAGSYAASITTGRILHGLDVLMQMDYDYAVTTNKRNASIRGARIQAYGHNNVDGSVTGVRATSQLKGGYTFLGRIVENSSSYGGIGIDVRMETTGTGTVTIGDGTVIGTSYGFAGILLTYKGANALTGNVQYIVMNIPYEGAAVSGETVGIKFVNQVVFTGTAFDVGIDFGTGMVVKMIDGAVTPASGSPDAIHLKTTCATGVTLTRQQGIYIETEVLGTGIITQYHRGIYVETYVESTATVQQHEGITCVTNSDIAGNQTIYPLRLGHNGISVAHAFIYMTNQATKMRYMLQLDKDTTWVDDAGALSVAAGKIKIRVGALDRWIQLYSS